MNEVARTCGWCTSVNVGPRTSCVSCGGPLPMLPGQDPGPLPPPAPRELPAAYRVKKLTWGNFGVWFGAIFVTVGVIFTLSFCAASLAFPPMCVGCPFGAFFLVPGLLIGGSSYRAAVRQLAAYRDGVPTTGTIVAVNLDTSTSVNGRHPWTVQYVFEADGAAASGTVTCFDPMHGTRRPGQPVHVVYLPDDPTVNALWPPPA